MLGKHTVHNTSVLCQLVIVIVHLRIPCAVLFLEGMIQTVGHGLIRSEDTEILVLFIQLEDIADISAQFDHILCLCLAGLYFNAIITEIRETQILHKKAAVGMGIGSHTGISFRCQLCDLGNKTAGLIEEFFRLVALQPFSQQVKMLRLLHGHRHLMGTEGSLDLVSIHYLRPCPSLRSAQYDHRPQRSCGVIVVPGIFLDFLNLLDAGIHRLSHHLMHRHRIVTLDKMRLPSTTQEEVLYLLMGKARKYSRVADLITIHIKDRQHGSVIDRIQEFIRMP